MDSGDVLALVAGIVLVIIVAILANPGYLSELQDSFDTVLKPAEMFVPPYAMVTKTPGAPGQAPNVTMAVQKPDLPPYRISFTDRPFSYPVYKLPENLATTGASETPRQTQEWVPFAVIENNRGGLTEVFSVPYPVWMINTTVIAKNQPQYANLRMALCYADAGGIIKAEEIVHQGTSYRVIRTANTRMYMIISVRDIDLYHIRLETTREYYDAYRQG